MKKVVKNSLKNPLKNPAKSTRIKDTKAQVWIETVIYTLIALAILGAVLSFARPKIESLQDKAIIEQSIKMLENTDSIIEEIKDVEGNKRQIELTIKKGSLVIDAEGDQIIFNMKSRYEYSEPCDIGADPGADCTPYWYKKGDINITTIKKGNTNEFIALLDYSDQFAEGGPSGYDIQWKGSDDGPGQLTKSTSAYDLFISNNRKDETDTDKRTKINFEFAS